MDNFSGNIRFLTPEKHIYRCVSGGIQWPHILVWSYKCTASFQLRVSLSMYDLLLPPGLEGLKACKGIFCEVNISIPFFVKTDFG